MLRSVTLLTLLVFGAALVRAQGFRPGFILKPNGDSLAGFVSYRSGDANAKSCTYRPSEKGEKITYHPEDLRGYGFIDDKLYLTKNVLDNGKKEPLFVEVLVKGRMSLYKSRFNFLVEKDSLILLPPPVHKLVTRNNPGAINSGVPVGDFMKEDNTYIGILNYLLSDCGLTGNFANYNERPLVNIVQNYNRCKGGPGLIYKLKKPWAKVNPSVFIGIDRSTIRVDDFEKYSIGPSTSLTTGISLDVSSPRINDRLFFEVELWYVTRHFQGYYQRNSIGGVVYREDLIMDASYIKVPLGIRYNFMRELNTIYVKTGGAESFVLKSSGNIIRETESQGVVTTEQYNANIDSRNMLSVWFGIGYSRQITGRWGGFIEIRMEEFSQFRFPVSTSKGVTLNGLFGLRF